MVLAETAEMTGLTETVILSNVQLGVTKDKSSPDQQKSGLRIAEYDDYLIIHPGTPETQRLIEKACNQTKRLFKHGLIEMSPADWKASLNTFAKTESKGVQKKVRDSCKAISDTSVLSIQMCVTYTIMLHGEDYKVNFYVSYAEGHKPKMTQKVDPGNPKVREITGVNLEQQEDHECSITRSLTDWEIQCIMQQYFKKICIATMMHLAIAS